MSAHVGAINRRLNSASVGIFGAVVLLFTSSS